MAPPPESCLMIVTHKVADVGGRWHVGANAELLAEKVDDFAECNCVATAPELPGAAAGFRALGCVVVWGSFLSEELMTRPSMAAVLLFLDLERAPSTPVALGCTGTGCFVSTEGSF